MEIVSESEPEEQSVAKAPDPLQRTDSPLSQRTDSPVSPLAPPPSSPESVSYALLSYVTQGDSSRQQRLSNVDNVTTGQSFFSIAASSETSSIMGWQDRNFVHTMEERLYQTRMQRLTYLKNRLRTVGMFFRIGREVAVEREVRVMLHRFLSRDLLRMIMEWYRTRRPRRLHQ